MPGLSQFIDALATAHDPAVKKKIDRLAAETAARNTSDVSLGDWQMHSCYPPTSALQATVRFPLLA
jgi:hypothetical protein